MSDIPFIDTSGILAIVSAYGRIDFSIYPQIILSARTIEELKKISRNPLDIYNQQLAQAALKSIKENPKHIQLIWTSDSNSNYNNLKKELSLIDKKWPDEICFITNDLLGADAANQILGDGCIEYPPLAEKGNEYTGYKEVIGTNEELERLYKDEPGDNIFNLLPGQYLLLQSPDRKIIDIRCWNGFTYDHLKNSDMSFSSKWFGNVVPYQNDTYQKLLFHSLHRNQITMVKGPAGCGKSYVALACLMSYLEKGIIDKIVVFCNTVAAAHAAKLGLDG